MDCDLNRILNFIVLSYEITFDEVRP